MTGGQRAVVASGSVLVLGILAGVLITIRPTSPQNISLSGVVLTEDSNPRKQVPISGAEIIAEVDQLTVSANSDSSGFFRLPLSARVDIQHPAVLRFRRRGYQPLDKSEIASDRICVARMVPTPATAHAETNAAMVEIADVRVRYSVKTTTTSDVASIAQTFEVRNTGNIPCHPGEPCSPDGRWRANTESASFDAGKGNEFREPRASCIAGPCPFSKIEAISSLNDGRTLTVSARDWSDTTTFLVEGEITRTQIGDIIRYSYPVIFGQQLDFTLPAAAEGPSIEADLSGSAIVFPLGPDLNLSWAACSVKMDANRSNLYRCELRTGYRFR